MENCWRVAEEMEALRSGTRNRVSGLMSFRVRASPLPTVTDHHLSALSPLARTPRHSRLVGVPEGIHLHLAWKCVTNQKFFLLILMLKNRRSRFYLININQHLPVSHTARMVKR